MLRATYIKYALQLAFPAGTSRGTLHYKDTWFVKVWNDGNPLQYGIGECACFKGLSMDDRPDYEEQLAKWCQRITTFSVYNEDLLPWPSIMFGLEAALQDLLQGSKRVLFPSSFADGEAGIPINGLIWMGSADFVQKQIKEKLQQGFRCLKMKIGAASLDEELRLLKKIRAEFSPSELEIRLDANGAFQYPQALEVLKQFSVFNIHSVEQPIKAGRPNEMLDICLNSPIDIALDEELIGKNTLAEKQEILSMLKPRYIILKPSLVGGFVAANEWIDVAQKLGIDWWITSALESNIGLNAISQWTYSLNVKVTQGLGTGGMYTNNIPSPLLVKNQQLYLDKSRRWDLSNLQFHD